MIKFIVVDTLTDARAFHVIIDFFDGRINGIDGDITDRMVLVENRHRVVSPAAARS